MKEGYRLFCFDSATRDGMFLTSVLSYDDVLVQSVDIINRRIKELNSLQEHRNMPLKEESMDYLDSIFDKGKNYCLCNCTYMLLGFNYDVPTYSTYVLMIYTQDGLSDEIIKSFHVPFESFQLFSDFKYRMEKALNIEVSTMSLADFDKCLKLYKIDKNHRIVHVSIKD